MSLNFFILIFDVVYGTLLIKLSSSVGLFVMTNFLDAENKFFRLERYPRCYIRETLYSTAGKQSLINIINHLNILG